MHDDPVTDERSDVPTVFDRLVAAGLSQERIEQHLTAGRVRIDGELVTDPDRLAPRPRGSCWGRSKRQSDSLASGYGPLRCVRHHRAYGRPAPVRRAGDIRRFAGGAR
jgi:hypothetical protein